MINEKFIILLYLYNLRHALIIAKKFNGNVCGSCNIHCNYNHNYCNYILLLLLVFIIL